MKRILCLLVIISMVLAMVSCQSQEEKSTCKKCGTSTSTSSNYCSNCGNKTNENEEALSESSESGSKNDQNNELEDKYQRVENWIVSPDDNVEDIYNLLKELGNYKDSEFYLSRFTVIPDALSYISKSQTNAFDETNESIYKKYSYNKNGVCFDLPELNNKLRLLGIVYANEQTSLVYDDSGVLIEVSLYADNNPSTTMCKAQIEYDSKGNIQKTNFLTAGGNAWSNTYTYKDDKLIEANIIIAVSSSFGLSLRDSHTLKFQYDGNGNVVKLFGDHYSTDSNYIEEYSYNENGCISEIRHYSYDDNGELKSNEDYKKIYTYDKNLRIISSKVTEYYFKNPTEYTLNYHYEDIIIYNAGE